MRICVICEGCYPFVAGGVSSWLQDLILSTPQHEFVIWAIGAQEKAKGNFAYKLPENVVSIQDVYLDSVLNMSMPRVKGRPRLTSIQRDALKQMMRCRAPDWNVIFDAFRLKGEETLAFLADRDFLAILQEICRDDHPFIGFSDYFWTIRSMFLPLLYLLGGPVPQADLYFSVSAGYAGVLGAMASSYHKKPYVLTEHGIYTREREEEIIRTDWVPQHFKDLWINMFYMFTRCAYSYADQVTALFARASLIQQEIGCDRRKCRVIQNGVKLHLYKDVPQKQPDGWIDVGAIVRVVPIKDIKTMLYAFAQVESEMSNIRLHIMGPTTEDEEYYDECMQLLGDLGLKNAFFTGRVNVPEYMAKIDFTLLTSISEGQPLSVLEGMAAHRPAVSTDVGSCRELIEGVDDGFGHGGICVPVMHQQALAEAILALGQDGQLLREMGENGYNRVTALFSHATMLKKYLDTFDAAIAISRERWKE